MKSHNWVAALIFALSNVTTGLLAEDQSPAAPGSRVRITAPSVAAKPLIGTIVAEDDDSLTIEVHGRRETVGVPRSALTKLEVSRSPSRHGRWAGRGALAGALVGGILGYAAGDSNCDDKWLCFSHEATAAGGIILLTPIGALIGALTSPGERWEEAPARGLRIGAAPLPVRGRGLGLAVTVGF